MDSSDEDSCSHIHSNILSQDKTIQKDWTRMKTDLHKDGYRSGISAGKDRHLQEHFDKTYQLSFEHGFKIGQLKGVVEALLKDIGNTETREKDKLEKIFKSILDEEDSAQKRPMQENENFSDAMESAKKDWESWCTDILYQLKEVDPDKAKLLDTKWHNTV